VPKLTDDEIRDAKNRARLAFPFPGELDLGRAAQRNKINEVSYKSPEGRAMLAGGDKKDGTVQGGGYTPKTGITRVILETPPEAKKAILAHELGHSAENQLGMKAHDKLIDAKLEAQPDDGEFMSPNTRLEKFPGKVGSPQHEAAVHNWSIRAAARNGGQLLDESMKQEEERSMGKEGTMKRAIFKFITGYTPVKPSKTFDYDRMLEANKANP